MVHGAGDGGVVVERGVDYGLGKLADVYLPRRDTPAPLALLWHGVGVDLLSARTIADVAGR